jgi:uncharacterized protein YvpB
MSCPSRDTHHRGRAYSGRVGYLRRGAAAIVAVFVGTTALAMATVTVQAAMIRLPIGTQRMQMPLDCEATSLTIALASVGVHTTQQDVQGQFPTDTRSPILGADGLPAEWGDPYLDFVGHVMGSEPGSNPHWTEYAGWGAYAPTVARVAESLGVPVAPQLTGWNPQTLYAAVEAGHPVLVWTTVDYSSETARTWTAWDGRVIPWTEAGHVVVLMGVNPTAGTLEFSDPLTGGYNGTTMAQFARTFGIYGDMAIEIERTAHVSTPAAISRRVVIAGRRATPVAPRSTPWAPGHHLRVLSAFSDATLAGAEAGGVGLLTTVSAPALGRAGVFGPLLATAALAAMVAAALLGVLMRRRRQPRCAG